MRVAAFVLYALFVGYVSLLPGDAISINMWDKLAHFLVYSLFAVLAHGVCRDKKTYALICLGIVAYGGLLELGQAFSPGRMMSANDLLANGLGVLAGAMFISVVFTLLSR